MTQPGPAAPLRVRRSLDRALAVLVIAVSLVTLILGALLVQPDLGLTFLLVFYVLIGWANVVVGAVAWSRRPGNRTGLLLCVAGLLTLVSGMSNVTAPLPAAIGLFLAQAPIAAVLHQVVAFPSGRLNGRIDIALVVAGYAVTVLLTIPLVVAAPDNPATIVDNPAVVEAARYTQRTAGFIIIGLAAVILVRRLRARRSRVAEHRSLAVVYGYGIGLILLFPVTANVLRPLFGWSSLTLFAVQITGLAGMPFVLGFAILRGGFARTMGIEELGAQLGASDVTRASLRDALAEALGDPSVDLLFPTVDDLGSDRLVDAFGRERSAPDPLSQRAVVEVGGPRGVAALIVYDSALNEDAALVAATGRVTALALERERLLAELLASREAVRESRTRLLTLSDEERRRMAQDLHDLVQSRLVLAALHAGTLAAGVGVGDNNDGGPGVADADGHSNGHGTAAGRGSSAAEAALRLKVELTEALVELRGLVHGVMPALLLERGLFAAAEDLVDRQPLPVRLTLGADHAPIPSVVASNGYFILVEALSNIVKHSQATRATVSLTREGERLLMTVSDNGIGMDHAQGSGLRGMRDRVAALSGRIEVDSSATTGTSITVDLPCGS